MKDNDAQAAVKAHVAPTLGAESGPVQPAKDAGAKAKAPPPPKQAGGAADAGKSKVVPADIPSAAPTEAASKSKKTNTVAGVNGMPNTEKPKHETKAVKAAEVEATKSKDNPVNPEAPKPGVSTSPPAPKPPVPEGGEPDEHPQAGHPIAHGHAVDGATAPKLLKLKPGVELFNIGPGVPPDTTAVGTDPETDFGGFTPPGGLPGGNGDGGLHGQAMHCQTNGQAHASSPPITVGIGESPIRLTVMEEGAKEGAKFTEFDLGGDEFFDGIRKAYVNTGKPATFMATDLLDWPDASHWGLLNVLKEIGPVAKLQVDEGEPRSDVFEAALGAMVDDADVVRCTKGRRLAQEAAALFRGDMLDVACSRIDKRLKELKVGGVRVAAIVKEVRALVEALAKKPEHTKLVAVVEQVPGAPVGANIMVPADWKLGPGGILRPGPIETIVASAPLVITSLMTDVSDGTESLGLAWKKDDGWVQRVVERHVAADARSAVKLAAWGAPVHSNNAGDVVQYIADFEAANMPHLPRRDLTGQMGWPGDRSCRWFLWGGLDLAANDPAKPVDPSATAAGVSFRGADEGEEQLVSGFRAAGSYGGWRAATGVLEGAYPRVGLGLLTSLTPPVLEIVDAENFILDYAGATSLGKTTALRQAAGLWGNPDERSTASAMSTWDSTRTWVERASAVLNSLPLILDDTKRARHPADIAQTLYDVATGRGKNRGTVKGLARAGTWRTALISSGEAPIVSFTEDGGTRARVLPVWGSPFGAADAATAKVVRALDAGVRANYGHVGPRFVRHLIEKRGEWPTWRASYREILETYTTKAGDNPVAGRMAGHFAAIELTACLVMEAFDGLCWVSWEQFDALWGEMTAEAPEADTVRRALRHAFDWATGRQREFYGRHETDSGHVQHPSAGWAGRWDDSPQWAYLGFLPPRLKDVLVAGGFEFESTVRNWADRGWLLINGSSKTRYRAQIGGETTQLPWLIAVRREAIAGLDAGVSA